MKSEGGGAAMQICDMFQMVSREKWHKGRVPGVGEEELEGQ